MDGGSCSPPYAQDWEQYTGSWKDASGQAPTLAIDASAPAGQAVQQINRSTPTGSGDYFSQKLDVTGGQTYSVRAYLKWVSGAAPFVGLEQFAGGVSQGINWLIGTDYTDAKGSTTVVSNSDTGWQARETILSLSENTTQVRLVDALFESGSKGGEPLAYFDYISIDTSFWWWSPSSLIISTDKSTYVVGEPVVVNWSSRTPIGGRLQLSTGESFNVAPALMGSHTFENLPDSGGRAACFVITSGSQLACANFTMAIGVTDKTEYLLGTPVVVNWGNMGVSGGKVVVAPVGSALSAGVVADNADLSKPGSYTFTELPVGYYEVRFLDASSNMIGTTSTNISVYPKFAATQPLLVPYDFVVATWRDTGSNAQDWVAIALDGSSDATVIDWVYTGGVAGSHAFGPLAAGTYRARYFEKDTNTKLYESEAIQVRTLAPISFAQVDAGAYDTCGITPEHRVKCWGWNGYGQLGNGTYTDSPSPVEVAGLSDVTAVGTGGEHSCAVTGDGKVHCWGANWYGQLGSGTSAELSPVPIEAAGILNVVAVSLSDYHTCAVTSDGEVQCWGANWYGQLGHDTSDASIEGVVGLSNVVAISAGIYHTCAVTSDGKVHCWGANWDGQLGDGSANSVTIPVETWGISTATAVASAGSHTCAVTGDGKVHCWGNNMNGNLGNGTTVGSAIPVEVLGISNAVAVSVDDDHSCARLRDGTARCWGLNGSGQLGNRTRADTVTSLPVEVVGITTAASINAAGSRSCALLNSGSLQCWGDNSQGYLGDGTISNSAETSAVADMNGISVESGTACATSENGHVYCWGSNGYGQVGDGSTVFRDTPVDVGLTSVASVDAANSHTCAVETDGRVRCWGINSNGQLGNGTTTYSAIPVMVAGVSNALTVSNGDNHTCALTNDERVRCWGANSNGQLGNGTSTDSPIPVIVAGISSATMMSSGGSHACAVTNNGRVMCWGSNWSGQLGDGTLTSRLAPVEVVGITDATAVSCGSFHTCSLNSEHKVVCWGGNYNGELGNKTYINSRTPVDVLGITNAVSIDLGNIHSCTRLNEGKVMCWGHNGSSQLGDGTAIDRSVPVEMGGVDNALAVSAGGDSTCVLHSNNRLRCWGSNYGQFGDGKHPYALAPVTVMSLQ